MPDAAKQIEALRQEIRRHERLYYVDAKPEISDREFDELLKQLEALEAEHPHLITPDSPTQRVGGEPIDGFETVPHARRMYSIDNTYNFEDLTKWAKRCYELIGIEEEDDEEAAADSGYPIPGGYFAEPKIDGVAISLRYVQGKLIQALTRGDGTSGDDVIANVRAIRSVPLVLEADEDASVPEVLEVRGEIFMPQKEFLRLNAEAEAAGSDPFANPRNATAGTLKQLKPQVVAERKLQFIAHGSGERSDDIAAEGIDSHSGLLEQLARWGVPINSRNRRCESLREAIAEIEAFDTQRAELSYGVDGVVVKVDRYDYQEQLGYTSKFPRWAIAYKYAAEQAETTVLEIQWQMGKTGKLTPRARMEPVFVAGTTVQHATLHNFGELQRKDVRVGDQVIIEKAGEIIPQVVRTLVEKRPAGIEPVVPPSQCPECGSEVEPEIGNNGRETGRYCINPECPAQLRERLMHFAGRGQMDIDGLGEKAIVQLAEAGLLNSFGDVFALKNHRDEMLKLERMGEKKVDNLLASIEAVKSRGLARVLASLGIRHVGSTGSRILAQHYGTLDVLMEASEEDIRTFQIDGRESGIGEEIAKSLFHFLHSERGQFVFQELREAGVDLTEPQPEATEGDSQLFAGKSLVVTGKLEQYSREEIHELIRQHGGRAASSVSKSTDYLIAGEKAGSKLAKAEKLGVEVISEGEFLGMLEDVEL